MRAKLVTFVGLLGIASCAHQQTPGSTQEPAPEAQASARQEPGTMTPVAISETRESGMDGRQSTAALPEQPVQGDARLGTSEQPLSSPQPLNSPGQPGATASGGSTNQALRQMERADGQQKPAPVAEPPAPPGESNRIASTPSPSEIALRQRIQDTLSSAQGLSYSARHVSIAVEKREVTLVGDVRNQRERNEVERLVQQIQGVARVKNQLSVVNQTLLRDPNTTR